MNTSLAPTTFVIFGVSGDLARNKLLPALNNLYKDMHLPESFHVVGVSRREWDRHTYLEYVRTSLGENSREDFLNHNSYVQGTFDDAELYQRLAKELERIDAAQGVCSNKLLYLAVPPHLYETVLEHVSSSGLSASSDGEKGWTHILIEKPFGNDSETATALDMKLGKLFKEEQIFRIDHYLAKETIQNILAFRFSNSLFEPLWNKKHIRAVEIKLLEKNKVGDRGSFYDTVGALKDVGQNHALQMLALVAMERPENLSALAIRQERARVLSSLKIPADSCIIRGQYEGYLEEKGVATDSTTETFFSIRAHIKNRRWRGVPFYITSGKALKESCVQIDIYFEDDETVSFLPHQFPKQEQNKLTFKVQPHEGISILFWSKIPGFENKIESKELSFEYGNGSRKIDAYEKVLRDCILGDQTLFASTDEVRVAWKFIEGVVSKWKHVTLHRYDIGSQGPQACAGFIKT